MGVFVRRQDSDEAIIRRVLAGQRDDFGILVRRYLRAVHAIGCARTGNPTVADDAAQETFIKAYLSLDTLREPRCFGSWLLSIARNIAHNLRRAETRRAEYEREAVSTLPQTPPPDEQEMRRVLQTQLDRLDEPTRELLLLHYYAGKNTRELAELLNISRDAVKKRLQRARESLGGLMVRELQPAVDPSEPEERRAARIVAAIAGLHPAWTVVVPATGFGAAFGLAAALKTAAVLAVVGLGIGWYAVSGRESAGERVATASAEPALAAQPAPEAPQPSADASQAPTAAPEAPAEVPKTAVPAASATTGVIQGRVYDSDRDTPIPGVDIVLKGPGKPVIAKSDAQGRYRAADLPPGDYHIERDSAPFEGYPHRYDQEAQNVVLRAAETLTVDYPLSQGTVIAGRVTDEAGKPLGGVTVHALTNQENQWRDTDAGPDGRFLIAGFVGPGTGFTVCAAKAGYAMPPRKNLDVPEGGLHGLELVMVPESTVSGTVVDAQGNPLANVGVDTWLPQGGQALEFGGAVFTGADGAFTLDGLYRGRFSLIITTPGSRTFSVKNTAAEIELAREEHLKDLVLVSEAGGLTVSGHVYDTDGDPVQYANVYVVEGDIFSRRSAQTDSDGAYTLMGLEPGLYDLTAETHAGRFQQHAQKEAVPAGSEGVDIVIDAQSTVRGVVVDAETRQPVTEFDISTDEGDRPEPDLSAVWQYRRVQDQQGRFDLDRMLPGEMTLYARAAGYAQGSVLVNTKVGETLEGVTIPLSRGKAIEGVVRNKQGEPLPGAMVYLGPIPGQQYRSKCAVATAGPRGEFTLHVQPAPVQTLSAYHTAYAPAAIDVPLAGNDPAHAEFTLGVGGSIEGTLLTQEGQPVTSPTQPVLAPTVNAGIGEAWFESKPIDENGRFRIDGITPGQASLVVYYYRSEEWPPTMSRALHQDAVVREGAVTRVDFVVPTGTAALEGARNLGDRSAQVTLRIPLGTGGYLAVNSVRDPESYSFTELPAGPATLHVSVWDEAARALTEIQTYNLTLIPNQTLRQDIVLP